MEVFGPVGGDGGAVVFWDTGGGGDQDGRFFLPCFLTSLSVSTIGVTRRGTMRRYEYGCRSVNVLVNWVNGPMEDERSGALVVIVYRIVVPLGACQRKSAEAVERT